MAIKIVNPSALARSSRANGGLAQCGQHSDAPYCPNPASDVSCTGELYRGCPVGQTDCADTDPNPDDSCCFGWGPGIGDNIDHSSCRTNDAGFGSYCPSWYDDDACQSSGDIWI